jgi:flagellar biosynthesis/type III secretory pathway protein FliH
VEIAQWRKRFEDHIDTRGTIHAQRVERAQRSGYEKGFEEGLLHERAERIAAIDILLREAKRKKEQAVHDLEARVIELAVGIAERIIGRRISVEPEIVADIIREAMSHIIGGETVILKVSEEDLDLVNAQYEKLLVLSGSAHEFRVEADRRLRRGDCLVETEGGLIDAVLASRLDYLTEELLKHT